MKIDISRAVKLGLIRYDHQLSGVKWALKGEETHFNNISHGGMITDEMGLGKTYQILSIIVSNFKRSTLIVLPRSLIEQWEHIIETTLGHKAFIYHGNKSYINVSELSTHPIVLTTYGMVSNLSKSCHQMKWDRIVFDEAHILRTMSSAVHKGGKYLRATYKWVVTGTPIQNHKKDYHSLCDIIDIPSSIYKKDENIQMIVDHCILHRTLESIGIKLPPLNTHTINVNWKGSSGKMLSNEIHTAIRYRTITPMIGLYVKAKQCCVMPNLVKTHELSENEIISPFDSDDSSDKLKLVCDSIISRHVSANQRKLVFCHYTKEIDYIYESLHKIMKVSILDGRIQNGQLRRKILTEYNDALIIQYNSGCDGLNLQDYTDIYFVSPHWNPAIEDQAIARSWRIGQTKPVNVFKFKMELIENELTMDHYIRRAQTTKRKGMLVLQEAIEPDVSISNECVICKCDMSRHTSNKYECGHTFHMDCMSKWLSTHHTCPICRAVI